MAEPDIEVPVPSFDLNHEPAIEEAWIVGRVVGVGRHVVSAAVSAIFTVPLLFLSSR
jgi:hypothetical protein